LAGTAIDGTNEKLDSNPILWNTWPVIKNVKLRNLRNLKIETSQMVHFWRQKDFYGKSMISKRKKIPHFITTSPFPLCTRVVNIGFHFYCATKRNEIMKPNF
jgi:hypothetical protein